ncbi:MAG: hypothetical protein AMK73_02725 [Planctomycetes bacterium SM23_32]|nr:MAG: hypothetical protein AMK73_02725 [Planctomycetes bacterium SM23_32]
MPSLKCKSGGGYTMLPVYAEREKGMVSGKTRCGSRCRWGAAALAALVFAAGGAEGCAALAPELGPQARTTAGHVDMDWASRRALRLLSHDFRRGPTGRLIVRVGVRNDSDSVFIAKLRVRFADEAGLFEKGSHETHVHHFPVGATSLEWTSATPAAQRYEVQVLSARWFQW